jgi:hypothetical protein
MIVGAAGTRELRSGVTPTSPRLRGEVGALGAPGEGESPRSLLSRDAPHPNPLCRNRMFPTSTNRWMPEIGWNPISGAGGERGHTERAGAFTFPNEWR